MRAGAAAPGRADAERAAAVLAEAGAGRVVLFGSVARGEANERSDIDLMAVYDDLDYGKRREKSCELEKLAERAVGFPVDVSVTDRAEWRMRTTRVLTSLEGRVARYGMVLVDRPAGVDVDWGKEMVMPASDYAEALARLEEARTALGELLEHLGPGRVERSGSEMVDMWMRMNERLQSGCGNAHMVVELSLKALIHLEADSDQAAWGHDIGRLCARLPEPHRSAVPALLSPLGADAITPWRTEAVYHRTGQGLEVSAEGLSGLARAACRVVSYTAERFPADEPDAARIRGYVRSIEEYLENYDIESGEPLRQ